ncbi:MAG: FG-GAP repeat protein [Verrucomicrobiaceae bacterium]|nr:FG-GAP repeat protein [Verrucomicrobiaceae bacterium]
MRTFLIIPIALCTSALADTPSRRDPKAVPEGLAKSDWQNIRAAYETGRHSFQSVEGGWQAINPGQQWTTTFDRRGFLTRPREGNWSWGLELTRYGYGAAQREIRGTPIVKAAGQRLSYQWDANVQEWFVNDQRGLEHGFTVNKRPAQPSGGLPLSPPSTLIFTLATRGSLTPRVSADAQAVLYQDASGNTVLNYAGLKVWDADGKVLPSRFEPAGEGAVRLHVTEHGARYPLTIDPIAQQAYVKASNTGADDLFGLSVSISGDTVAVGALWEDSSTTGINSTPDDAAADSGAVYVFVRSGGAWTQQAFLKSSNSQAGDHFGASVSISNETLIVGAPAEDSQTTGINSTPDEFASQSGAAYVFVRSGAIWTQQAYLKASNTGVGDFFGDRVAIDADTVVVGARGEASSSTGVNSTSNNSAPNAGAAYVFVRSGSTWAQQAYLKASNTGGLDTFGYSLALSRDTVVVGAIREDSDTTGVNSIPNELATNAGAAYVFFRNGTTWTQQAFLKASNTGANDFYGVSVAISGDTLVVGSDAEDSSTTGVNSTPNESADGAGAAYVYVRSGTTWTQQAYLKASNTGTGDNFGSSVAINENTLVVGAWLEDSSTAGVNTTPNEAATDAGAAYVFTRTGSVWTQDAYLKAGNPGAADYFGRDVAISGDTVIVGAYEEDSGSTGVNSSPNESASRSGATYFFTGFNPVADSDSDGLLDSWELMHWPTRSGHSALDDNDHDGYVELLELALGLNPTQSNPGALPPLTQEGGYLTMTITKQPGVSYEVQSAGTLTPAQPGFFSPASTTVLIDNATTLKVRDNTLIGTPPSRFMRMKVTTAP